MLPERKTYEPKIIFNTKSNYDCVLVVESKIESYRDIHHLHVKFDAYHKQSVFTANRHMYTVELPHPYFNIVEIPDISSPDSLGFSIGKDIKIYCSLLFCRHNKPRKGKICATGLSRVKGVDRDTLYFKLFER